jgi:hypothetical protein
VIHFMGEALGLMSGPFMMYFFCVGTARFSYLADKVLGLKTVATE